MGEGGKEGRKMREGWKVDEGRKEGRKMKEEDEGRKKER